MPATALPFNHFDEIIAEDKIKFSVKGHRGGHISKESPERRHIFSSAFLINITTLWLISPVGKGDCLETYPPDPLPSPLLKGRGI
jgi:hypothetical protein